MVWLVQVVAPLCLALYLTIARRSGGAARLWRDAVVVAALVAAGSLWQREITYHYEGPLNANGVDTWPFFPLAVLVMALIVQILPVRRVSPVLSVPASAIVGSVTLLLGGWIS